MDSYLLQDLAESAPSSWPRLLARHEAASAFLALPGQTSEAARQLADSLGIGKLSFDRLVCARKQQLQGKFRRRPYVVQRRTPTAPEHERIIEMALEAKGAFGVTEAYECALDLSRQMGITPPTIHGLRSRYRTAHSLSCLRGGIDEGLNWVVDSCELELTTPSRDRVYLVALIDLSSGTIAGHSVAYNQVSSSNILATMIGVETLRAGDRHETCMGLVPGLQHHLTEVSEQTQSQGVQFVATKAKPDGRGRSCAQGEMLMRIFGKKIGRVAFRLRGATPAEPEFPLVERAVITRVIGELIRQRNTAALER